MPEFTDPATTGPFPGVTGMSHDEAIVADRIDAVRAAGIPEPEAEAE